ncbi:hypothetical protein ACS0TY_032723 [Phlomoides rotata]
MGILGSDTSNLQILDFWLRLLLLPFNAATIWIAVTTHQNNTTYGNLEFKHLIGLKYMVCISAVSAAFAVFSAVSAWLRCLDTKTWLFFLTDQVISYLMVTSMTAQGEFLYLAYNGDLEVSWSRGCASYGRFCNRLKVAVALHVIAVCCSLVLAVISAFRLFARFPPPFFPSKRDDQQRI